MDVPLQKIDLNISGTQMGFSYVVFNSRLFNFNAYDRKPFKRNGVKKIINRK
jgi:hypothetical protein